MMDLSEMSSSLKALGMLMEPTDAEPPILNPDVRATAYAWIHEQNAAEELRALNVEPRNTVLFYGPPGTGKTTLAHHLCARIGIQMLLVSAHDIHASLMGESEKTIARLFRQVGRVHDQVAIFLDEIDGIAPKRRDMAGTDRAHTGNLITFMRMLDHFPGIVFAATNRYDAIDPALLRRIEMKVPLLFPDKECRRAIILRYLRPIVMTDKAIDELTAMLSDASPALIKQLMEGMKRDLVMAERLGLATDAPSVFARLRASIQPPESETLIPFWASNGIGRRIAALDWPPQFPDRGNA
jgi:SpoVK/Ycf46/Vps4 family AAA+-type ATPase